MYVLNHYDCNRQSCRGYGNIHEDAHFHEDAHSHEMGMGEFFSPVRIPMGFPQDSYGNG